MIQRNYFFQTSIDPVYKKLSDYCDMIELQENDFIHGHARFIGKQKLKTSQDHCDYTDQWYLLMREGLYRAQIEKAMSEIYRVFLGRSTEIEIVKDNLNFYVASREIANFTTWDAIMYDAAFQMKDDETLVYKKNNIEKRIVDLGKLDVLTEFFRDIDVSNSKNYGVQECDNYFLAFKIDNEKSLEFKTGNSIESQSELDTDSDSEIDINNNDLSFTLCMQTLSQMRFKKDFTQTKWYQDEKQEMQMKIAATDFILIENIIRKNITSNPLESSIWLMNHIIKNTQDSDEKIQCKQILEQLSKTEIDSHQVLDQLRRQHEALQSLFTKKTGYPL